MSVYLSGSYGSWSLRGVGSHPLRALAGFFRRNLASGGGAGSGGRATADFSPLAEELRALAAVQFAAGGPIREDGQQRHALVTTPAALNPAGSCQFTTSSVAAPAARPRGARSQTERRMP